MSKVYFITGVSSGIGREVAIQLVAAGNKVFGCARREDRLESLSSEVSDMSGEFSYSVCDVTHKDEIVSAVRKAKDFFGRIDILYANSGFGVAGGFEKLKTDDFKRQFDTNVYGVLDTIYAGLDEVIKNKGSIVLMGSVNSHIAEPKKTPYCMSKFAIKALADGLYWEMKPLGVAVTLISPGIVESEIRQVDKEGIYRAEQKDPAPKKLILDTKTAARQIIRAIEDRVKEKLITNHGKVLVGLNKYLPFAMTPLMKQNRSVSRPNVN